MTDDQARVFAAMLPGREITRGDVVTKLKERRIIMAETTVVHHLGKLADEGHIERVGKLFGRMVYRRPE